MLPQRPAVSVDTLTKRLFQSGTQLLQSSGRQLCSRASAASTLAAAYAGISCDVPTAAALAAAAPAEAAVPAAPSMACSPPKTRSHTHTASFHRRLVVPTTCLAATKPRRKRSGSNGNGGGGGGDGDDFGGFGGGGDDDDDFFSWGDESSPLGASSALQDAVFLWTVFCAVSLAQTVHHVTKPLTRPAGVALGLVPAECRA